jgi:hypothetical protein
VGACVSCQQPAEGSSSGSHSPSWPGEFDWEGGASDWEGGMGGMDDAWMEVGGSGGEFGGFWPPPAVGIESPPPVKTTRKKLPAGGIGFSRPVRKKWGKKIQKRLQRQSDFIGTVPRRVDAHSSHSGRVWTMQCLGIASFEAGAKRDDCVGLTVT